MKKTFFSKVAMAMLMALTALTFSGCGSDEDDPVVVEPQWSTSYRVSFKFSEDVLKTADVTAHIAKPDGTFSEERISTIDPVWVLTGNQIPDKAGVLLTFVPKSSIVETDSYDIKIAGSIVATSFKDGKSVSTSKSGVDVRRAMKGDRLAQYYTDQHVAFALGINDRGSVEDVNIKDFDFGLNVIW